MNNAVHPDWQRHGIASAMYDRLVEVFRNEGMQFAFVETGGDTAHAPAVAAYRKAGFRIREDVVKLYRRL
jgi:ribosomal protein S18 acetylase RimI-like enzyme